MRWLALAFAIASFAMSIFGFSLDVRTVSYREPSEAVAERANPADFKVHGPGEDPNLLAWRTIIFVGAGALFVAACVFAAAGAIQSRIAPPRSSDHVQQ
jgi:hypothetical protein